MCSLSSLDVSTHPDEKEAIGANEKKESESGGSEKNAGALTREGGGRVALWEREVR